VIFAPVSVQGAYTVDIQKLEDSRGFFARTWCHDEFQTHNLAAELAQCSTSFNLRKGTLRGLHYQAAPYEEAKLVRCTMGAIFDVIVDLRPKSATFKKHFHVVLSAENRTALYIPEGVAHGFQTLTDNSEVFYQMSKPYVKEYSRGVRWDDPQFGIKWPEGERIILERDRSYPDFTK
jgi:dTDP-4-dehydrorhamnose 3,5-epimerase